MDATFASRIPSGAPLQPLPSRLNPASGNGLAPGSTAEAAVQGALAAGATEEEADQIGNLFCVVCASNQVSASGVRCGRWCGTPHVDLHECDGKLFNDGSSGLRLGTSDAGETKPPLSVPTMMGCELDFLASFWRCAMIARRHPLFQGLRLDPGPHLNAVFVLHDLLESLNGSSQCPSVSQSPRRYRCCMLN